MMKDKEFTGDIEKDLKGLYEYEPTPEEIEESEKVWVEIVESEKIATNKILRNNERIFNAILSVKGEKYLNAVKECLDNLNEDCMWFGLPPELSLVKKPKLNPQEEDWGEFKHVIVDQYCNGGMTGDEFAGYLYIPLKENLYLKIHYQM